MCGSVVQGEQTELPVPVLWHLGFTKVCRIKTSCLVPGGFYHIGSRYRVGEKNGSPCGKSKGQLGNEQGVEKKVGVWFYFQRFLRLVSKLVAYKWRFDNFLVCAYLPFAKSPLHPQSVWRAVSWCWRSWHGGGLKGVSAGRG